MDGGIVVSYRSRHAVNADRWDKDTLARMAEMVSSLLRARRSVEKVAPTGGEALDDAFWLLFKATPELVPEPKMRESHLVNHAVVERLSEMPATRRLRGYCVGDDFQAAASSVSLAPTLEAIFDRLAAERKLAEEMAEVRREMEALAKAILERVRAGEDEDPDMLAEVEALGERYREGLEELDERLADGLDGVARLLREATQEAAQEAASVAAQAAVWGIEPGQVQRLPPDERLRLAATLNTDKMQRIASLFGRLSEVTLAPAVARVDRVHDEIVDVELGGDLGRVVASELLLLGDEVSERDFLARWSDRSLMQYAVEGAARVGRGGIIVCLDSSYSMEGSRELWGKAFMLVLLHLAHRERREMHVIHFGSPGEYVLQSFDRPEQITPLAIVEAAELFLASGTDYRTPLGVALDLLRTEHAATGRTRADVVFITDGECRLSPEFLDEYLRETDRMGARTWGLDVTGAPVRPGSILSVVTGGHALSVKDLRSGVDVADLFRSLV